MDIVADIVLALLYHGIASGSKIKYNNWALHFECKYLFLHNNEHGVAWPYA